MDDLDRALTRLAGAPLPAALDQIDAGVFARIAAQPAGARIGLGLGALTTAVALAIGLASTGVRSPASASMPVAPLGSVVALAPSTLLLGDS